MTPQQAIDQFRRLADDQANPPHWSDDTLLAYLNEARQEAARRARLFQDMDTAEICTIKVKADKAIYAIDPRVIRIQRVKLDSQDQPLPKIHLRDLDRHHPGWETSASTRPCVWCPTADHTLRLIDPPDADDTMRLRVLREPLEDVVIDGDEESMELPKRTHPRLVDYVQGKAYLERDVLEKYRPEEARDRMAAFDREFGPPSPILDELWIHREHGYDEDEGEY